MHRLSEVIKYNYSYGPISLVSATASGTAVDTKGWSGAEAFITVGALTNTKTLDVAIHGSDDGTTYAAISGRALTQIVGGASAKNSCYSIPISDAQLKRYLKPIVTAGAGATALVCVNIALTKPEETPATAAAAGLAERA